MRVEKLSEDVVVLATEILQLKAQLTSGSVTEVNIAADVGVRLSRVRFLLMQGESRVAYKGQWSAFCRQQVALSPHWVIGYRALSEARSENAEWFNMIAELGITKAIRACRASVPFRWTISTKMTVDNQDAVGMTCDEFDAVINMLDPGAGVTLEEPPEAAKKRRAVKADLVEEITAKVVKLYDATPQDVGWITLAEWVRVTIPEEVPGAELARRLAAVAGVLKGADAQEMAPY